MRNENLILTKEQRKAIDKFLSSLSGFSPEQYWQSYRAWWRGGRGWWRLEQGGTGQMRALMWYQHRYKPNSREWRPAIIIKALLSQIQNGGADSI